MAISTARGFNFGRSQSGSKVAFVICGPEPLGDLDCTQIVGRLWAPPPWATALACYNKSLNLSTASVSALIRNKVIFQTWVNVWLPVVLYQIKTVFLQATDLFLAFPECAALKDYLFSNIAQS